MTGELISIVVPVYNVEKYVEKCLNSISEQTYKNIEVIVVDDGATDSSGEICDRFALTDDRFIIKHKKNGGLSSARNHGMKYANGKYMFFIDSDDWLENTAIESMYRAAVAYGAEIVSIGRYVARNVSEYVIACPKQDVVFTNQGAMADSMLGGVLGVAAWGRLYKKELWEGVSFPEGEIHEDVAVIYHVFAKCKKIIALGKPGYYYRFNPEGISKQNYSPKYNVVLKHVLDNEKFISESFPQLIEYSKAKTAQASLNMMICIAKTPNGVIKFSKEFEQYRKALSERWRLYIKLNKLPLKRRIWIYIMLNSNKPARTMYRLIGFYK